MLDLNSLLGQLTGTAQQRQEMYGQQVQQMNADTEAMHNLMTVNTQEALQVAQASADTAAKSAAVEYTRSKVLENAQATLGLNPDDVNNQLVQSMTAFNAAEDARKQARQQFDQLSQISLLDNPLGWLAAQLQLPQVAAKNNALVDQRDAAAENLATRQRLLTAHRSAVTANTADAVQQVRLEEANNQLAAARIKVREAEIANSSTIAGRKLQAFQLSDKIFDIESDLVNKQLQVGQYMMSMQERQEARAARVAEAADRLARKKDEEAEIAAWDVQFARVSQLLGMQVPMTYKMWKMMPDQDKKKAFFAAASSATLGDGLIGSIAMVSTYSNPTVLRQTNPGMASAVNGFTAAIDSYREIGKKVLAKDGVLTPKPGEVVIAGAKAYQDDLVDSTRNPATTNSLTSPRWDSVFNPYKAQHKVILDEVKAGKLPLADNILVKNLQLVPSAAADSGNITSADELTALKAVAEQVRQGKITIDAASQQVAQYYQVAANKNRQLYQYDLFNLPPQTSYLGQLPGMGFLSKPVNVELMSAASVRKGLLATIRGSQKPADYQKYGPAVMGIGFGLETSRAVTDALLGRVKD